MMVSLLWSHADGVPIWSASSVAFHLVFVCGILEAERAMGGDGGRVNPAAESRE